MDQQEHFPTDVPTMDPAEAGPDRRRSRRLVAVATGTTIALGAGGIAYAATSDPIPTPSNTAPDEVTPQDESEDPAAPEHSIDGHGPVGGFAGFGALHGEYVVETEDGVYQTVATQRGTIDEITDDSITVTSEDGYTATYVLDADALDSADRPGPMADPADLAVDDEVVVTASVENTTATVTRLIDVATLPTVRPGPGHGGPRSEHLPDRDESAPPDTETS